MPQIITAGQKVPDHIAAQVYDRHSELKVGGVLSAKILLPEAERHKAIIRGLRADIMGRGQPGYFLEQRPDGMAEITGYLHNAFVNQGLQSVLDSSYEDTDSAADRISHIALSGDNVTVTAGTTSIDPGASGDVSIKTIANVNRVAQTTSGDQTWTQADVTWPIYKIGLMRGATAADVSNIIGGNYPTGGTSPYDEPFLIDLTNIATWQLTMGIDVTLTAT